MQAEVIKHTPQPEAPITITPEEYDDILALGCLVGDELQRYRQDNRWAWNLAAAMAFLLGAESVVLFLVAYGVIAL